MLRQVARCLIAITVLLGSASSAAAAGRFDTRGAQPYQQTNLVSDLPGAQFTDANLLNPWGLTHSPTSPWWISDNGAGVSTLYNGSGQPQFQPVPLVVTIPPPGGSPEGTTAAPTGDVFNGTTGFVVKKGTASGPAAFIFATEDGTISGWNRQVDPTHAILEVDNSTVGAGAVYKGLALVNNHLYATNFRFGTIDVFDSTFTQVHLGADAFSDAAIPDGYAPFGIANIQGDLFVTYAKQDQAKHDDVAGAGHGFVDIFDPSGHLLKRLVLRRFLNSPWGLALAPDDFGPFSGALLVGNFGNGLINAFDSSNGRFLGQLHDQQGNLIQNNGLWGLAFGNDHSAGPSNTLFFTAGLNHEADGLFGAIAPTS